MKERIASFALACALVFLGSAPAFAQTSSLSGVAVDSNGGVLPGVTVVVKNVATGTTYDAVTNTEGVFSVPALERASTPSPSSLSGFKTAVVNDVRLVPGTPTSVKADARGRQPRRNDHRDEQQRAGEHADRDDLVHAQRRSDQPDADAVAQRAERRDVPARSQHDDDQPQLDHQRTAGIVPQHHARRREQHRQLQQVD